jgi:hypothetical protein
MSLLNHIPPKRSIHDLFFNTLLIIVLELFKNIPSNGYKILLIYLISDLSDRELNKRTPSGVLGVPGKIEATTGFEPVMRVLQTLAFPLGHVAGKKWLTANGFLRPSALSHLLRTLSGQWDSDPQPPPWQGGVLPIELYPQTPAGCSLN